MVVAIVAVVTAALPTPAVTTKDKSLKKSWKNSNLFFLRQQETTCDAGIELSTCLHTHTHTLQHSIHVECVAQSHSPHTNHNWKTT
jgi:hypothetical protein